MIFAKGVAKISLLLTLMEGARVSGITRPVGTMLALLCGASGR